MNLTEEQKYIIDYPDDLIIKACAGAGKTSTYIQKSITIPNDKILYLCFNKSIQLEAQQKFPRNTVCKTVHALAYKAIVSKGKYKLANYGYSTYDIKNILEIPDGLDYHGFKIANLVKLKLNIYVNSDVDDIDNISLYNYVSSNDNLYLLQNYEKAINQLSKKFWKLMDSKKIEITHDFYVKKYSFLEQDLGYDYIFVDEAQDISPCFIKIINAQKKAKKFVCGDFSQAIYGWRFGVGDFSQYFPNSEFAKLSNSFRFRNDIAVLCNKIIGLKTDLFGFDDDLTVIGVGNNNKLDTKCCISRTNSGVLNSVLTYIDLVDSIYIEGDLRSITQYDGFSLHDIISLYFKNKEYIKSKFVKSFESYLDLKKYADEVEARDLQGSMKLVEFYNKDIFDILKKIKEKSVEAKRDADIIFSTVHKSKGLEYNIVSLSTDFVNESELRARLDDENLNDAQKANLMEEINLLYVAASRTQNKLEMPQGLINEEIDSILNESHGDAMTNYLQDKKVEF